MDLFDIDTVEPSELPFELLAALLHGRCPDLGRDRRLLAAAVERGVQRPFRIAVHRRGVDEPRPAGKGRPDDVTRQLRVSSERVPRTETDDRAEAALFHHSATRNRAASPAAKAHVKKYGSSPRPPPMCESGRRPHSSCQPSTSTSSRELSQSGAPGCCGHATVTSAAVSSRMVPV